jgi:AcrR family transcriptional regulator
MGTPVRPRSTRDRPAKPPLGEDVILDVAMRILREEGLEAVTMRRLAAELDTGPASLYVYVSGRDELNDALLDRVAGLIALEEPDPARWRAQVHALMAGMLTTLEAHPGIATVALANPPTGECTLLVADNLIGLLRAGGIDEQDAAWACDILPLISTALAVESAIYQQRGPAGLTETAMIERLDRVFGALSPARFPNLTAMGAKMISGDGEQRFRFAIDVVIDGLVARAGREVREVREGREGRKSREGRKDRKGRKGRKGRGDRPADQ